MRAIAAKNIGFCSGVKRAVKIAQNSLKNDKKPIWFLGKLVHNELVIEKFKKGGIRFISNPRKAKSGTLIIQAHGCPPFSPKINVLVRDATCPLVKKVQSLASFLYNNGYRIVISGDKNHSEVKGINGHIKNNGLVVENEIQAKNLALLQKMRGNKLGVVVQTTQREENFYQILKILREILELSKEKKESCKP